MNKIIENEFVEFKESLSQLSRADKEHMPTQTCSTVKVCRSACCCKIRYKPAKTRGPNPQAFHPRRRNSNICFFIFPRTSF